ncbi:hypothetical protein GCM10010967_48250 [Dyadobacter beijingensis]|uniref:Uncharacterized protein n=2 Tax=Dyadobacter beijingensis TaxID=365489 RepID=A0ABQ2ICK8_9BACT|nr:hypothetical protein GCM10010967_48250 [Dyadobacter beijingensis]
MAIASYRHLLLNRNNEFLNLQDMKATDFDSPNDVSGQIQSDALFSCLRTTLKAAGSKGNQWPIDYEIPVEFLKASG